MINIIIVGILLGIGIALAPLLFTLVIALISGVVYVLGMMFQGIVNLFNRKGKK